MLTHFKLASSSSSFLPPFFRLRTVLYFCIFCTMCVFFSLLFCFMCTLTLITCKCVEHITVMHWKSSSERSVSVPCHSLGQGKKLIAVSLHCSQYFECNHVMMSVIFPTFCIVIQHTILKYMYWDHKKL